MTTKLDVGPALHQMKSRMEAIIAEHPVSVPRAAQAEFDSCLSVVNLLQKVETATLAGVQLNDLNVTPDGKLISRRQTQSQEAYESGVAIAEDAPNTRKRRGHTAEEIFGQRAPKSQWKSLEHFMWDITQGSNSIRMASGSSEGVPSDGGFLIPMEFVFDNLNASVEKEIVRPRCRVEGMASGQKTIATYDDSTHAGGTLFGGLKLQWLGEGETINFEVPKVRQMKLFAKKAVIMVPATNELLADAPSYASGVTERMVTALGFGLDYACLVGGTGGGQPLSVMNSPSTVTVTRTTTGKIVYHDLTSMLARLHPGCYSNSVWIFPISALAPLNELTIPIGVAGAFIKVMNESNGEYTILGRPVIFTEKTPTLGNPGDAMLVDLSQYVMGIQKDGFRLDMSQHLLFRTDESIFRLVVRIDGQSAWVSAFTPVNNGPTLSWAVVLS